MDVHPITIFNEPVRNFLAGVDLVLNSDTFILQFPILYRDVASSLEVFLHSPGFHSQMIQQDQYRDRHSFQRYDEHNARYTARAGSLVKENYVLKIIPLETGKLQYLTSMLTGDTTRGPFFSFYGKQKTELEAIELVESLLEFLFRDQPWSLFIVEPNFLWNSVERYLSDEIYYFGGDGGNDSASVIADENIGFLILTNGID
jgi:hypothetical protein